ncbi:MAG: hypothetical protein Q8P80_05665 [Candidatus Levybacteria bacterium]|nr:hypothetical protein [Candidatus Levybacteria bacterium]
MNFKIVYYVINIVAVFILGLISQGFGMFIVLFSLLLYTYNSLLSKKLIVDNKSRVLFLSELTIMTYLFYAVILSKIVPIAFVEDAGNLMLFFAAVLFIYFLFLKWKNKRRSKA